MYNIIVKIKEEEFFMKKKELKAIALKIVKLETIISENSDEQAVTNAKLELMRLTDSIESLSDMMVIDSIVQESLSRKSWLSKKFLI